MNLKSPYLDDNIDPASRARSSKWRKTYRSDLRRSKESLRDAILASNITPGGIPLLDRENPADELLLDDEVLTDFIHPNAIPESLWHLYYLPAEVDRPKDTQLDRQIVIYREFIRRAIKGELDPLINRKTKLKKQKARLSCKLGNFEGTQSVVLGNRICEEIRLALAGIVRKLTVLEKINGDQRKTAFFAYKQAKIKLRKIRNKACNVPGIGKIGLKRRVHRKKIYPVQVRQVLKATVETLKGG